MGNVLDLFLKNVSDIPNSVFVVDNNRECTYLEMYRKAINASKLISFSTESVICLFMEKGIEAIAMMLGAALAGKAYVFINTTAPENRIKKMMEVAGVKYLFAEECFSEFFLETDIEDRIVIVRKAAFDKAESEPSVDNCWPTSTLLYGMFTSGTTGIPKLVVASSEAVYEFIEDFVNEIGLSREDIVGNQAPFDFDVSVKDIYSTIYTGGKLVLIDKKFFSRPDELLDYIREKKINTLIWAVTALCMASATKEFDEKISKEIKKVCFSGEVMPMKYLRIWKSALPNCSFYNVYGPTEVICNCTWYQVNDSDMTSDSIPIGKPFRKRRVYLIDNKGNLICDDDVKGEICVGGGLSSGYYNNLEETTKKFVDFQINDNDSVYVYHTGDIGYYKNGLLYFVGRNDFQIKRMGYRIELGEIENRVMDIDGVELACCIYNTETQKLCLFYTGYIKSDRIRRELRNTIPVYMLPNRIIQLVEMPVNKNGKIDRNGIKQDYERYFA
ncbi:AMP-binding enzyme [Butyrivibrio proteoclasticus B316]|uniref:AMP-binding enzyme n=1 Tax=Butyrivibrio proteoclasticus (strain ATCC 51982 / DSM 14932 / B316) TaxID=515622 RepID=E0RX15_BUTPB|nr:AMP-binding protein [Butyrivibrio proteoclasticus]ADL34923.1 AMP-binding enzyme [Butyrivibrio proteoclasticus B316]